LVIDDSPSVRRATILLLSSTSIADRILEAPDGLSGFKLALSERPDLVLCDLEMPLCDGARFLSLVRSRAELEHVPVIMLTGEPDPERKAVLFEMGAADYVCKPFHPRELIARVQAHLRLKLMREELMEKNRHLAELSVTDGLTGLRNRRAFDAALELEVTRAMRYDMPLALALIDLDHFKQINDEHGHLVGDRVLAAVGAIARTLVRGCDVAARYGGEELAVILPHTTASAGLVMCERLRAAIAGAVFEGATVRVTASIGLAQFGDLVEKSPASLIAAADAAVYAAKAAGRNVVQMSSRPRSGSINRNELPTGRFRVQS
jgi:diguanylate cyclase (GGDEF)-like protein